MDPVRVAVIGVGRMGTNHVRILSEMPGAKLVAVCDANWEAAEKVGRRFFADRVYNDVPHLLSGERIDAAVVAVPTPEHVCVAQSCMEKGISILLEKPMAPTVQDCDSLLEMATSCGVKLMVGHVERYNPVILQLQRYLAEKFLGDLYYMETIRSGPFPKRLYGSKDGVVIDLAVHDLDLIAYLFGGLHQLYANHIVTQEHRQDIHARVLFKTCTGLVGSSQFSWISPRKERTVTIYGDNGILVGNLIDQEIWFYENGDVDIDFSDNYYQNVLMGRVSEGKVVKFPIKKEEPLKNELARFLQLVREDGDFDASYGRAAVRYSLAVLDSAREDRVVYFG